MGILLTAATACFETSAKAPSAVEVLMIHKRACVAKGENIIEKDMLHDEPCAATAMRLAALVATDEDCKAYYGDAGIAVELCGPALKDPPAKNGGLDGGD